MQTFGLRKTYGNCKLHIHLTYICMANVLLSNSHKHILYNYDNRYANNDYFSRGKLFFFP